MKGLNRYFLVIGLVAWLSMFMAEAAPDLFVSEFSLNPETPVQGSPVTVRLGVYNQGTGSSGPFSVQWWPGENYRNLGCSWEVDGLVARGGKILTCTYDGYPSWYANINTKVLVDSGGVVAESDEANNIFLKPISVSKPGAGSPGPVGPGSASGSPDLFVSEFSLNPETPVQGSPVTVRLGVYNQGTGSSGPFSVQWWPGENYRNLGCSWEVDGLVARGGKILTCTYDGYPSWYANINTKVLVDSGGVVAESDEANNIFLKPISVSKPGAGSPGPVGPGSASGSPDLFVSEFSLNPETPVQGSPVTVRLGVYNQGTGSSGPFSVQWWPGENYRNLGCSWEVDGLVARGGKILTCTYDGYPSWYANINTKVLVDSGGVVAESDEANNIFLKPISVNHP
ncbi:CARDB domain-containing protein [Methanothrix sp.]|uniref:CARDB domain-containing protein n=1 Tax=Methanothrix sp. TaxID=90426 RepID=UPI00345E298F